MDANVVAKSDAIGKAESNGCLSVSEQTDRFIKYFNKQKNNIEADLVSVEPVESRENLATYLNHINEEFQKLQHHVSDATMYLPMYNIRVAQESLKHLQDQIFTTQNRVLPKKKFAFKTRKIQSSSNDVTDGSKQNQQRKNIDIDFFECGFKNLQNQVVEKDLEEVNGKDVGLHCLEKCAIRISGCANTVHLSQLVDCQIYLGPVSTSVFIDNCSNCMFVVACQQLRVHCTTDCAIYLHVTSKAIIEDCSKLRFAPYNWEYDDIQTHFKMSGLDVQRNNWNDVDDFNWLAKDVPSPNWSVMPLEERLPKFK